MPYALELQSYNTCQRVRIGRSLATYERAARIARSVSNDPFWRQPHVSTPSEDTCTFIVTVAGGWLRVVKL